MRLRATRGRRPSSASIAGVLVIEAVGFIERRGIDDPVGAIAVHGVCGSFGVLVRRHLRQRQLRRRLERHHRRRRPIRQGVTGILCGDFSVGLGQLGAQAIGVLTIWTVIFGIAFAFFKIQNTVMKGGIRPTAEMEIEGMDMPEMGALAYPEFEFGIEHAIPSSATRQLVGSDR